MCLSRVCGCGVLVVAACRQYPCVNRCGLQSSIFKEAFVELSELPGAVTVSVTMSPTEPYLQLAAAGSMGSCTVEFPQV